jgi:glycosyltransferase involved in cell wall biosynthesis
MPTPSAGRSVRRPSATATAPAGPSARLGPFASPPVDAETAEVYEALVRNDHAEGPAGSIAFYVYTDDFAEGRGDVYVACGLGRALVRRGWGVRFVPRRHWKRRLDGVDYAVALVQNFDPAAVSDDIPLVAWVRNETHRWTHRPDLELYDMVLSSSELSLGRLRESYGGPTGLLPIGVDAELFRDAPLPRTATAVTSVNHWGRDRVLHQVLQDAEADADVVWYGDPTRLPPKLKRWAAGMVSYFALPAAYQQALLVLDDLNHTTLPFGSVNSRVFEAIACGALPLTNGGLGLAELGLDDVPVYHTSEQLTRLMRERREDRAGTRATVARLKEFVLREHTFDRRADQLLELLPVARDRAAQKRPTVAFYPDYRITNPYQDMLYGAAVDGGVRVVPVADPVRAPLPRDTGGDLSQRALHLHWTAPLLQSARGPHQAWRTLGMLRRSVDDFKNRGGKLIWTVHNVLPHECRWRSAEIELCRFLAERADVVHVMGEETVAAVSELYPLPPERTHVVPHSSYLGIYPDVVGREEARRRLRIRDAEITLLVLGGLRPYKGLARMFSVFDKASAEDARLRLLVAGKPGADPSVARWREHCEHDPRIVSSFSFVPDDQLQVWLRAADLAVFPYESILNSGALQLALTFGVPVIAPRTGTVESHLDPSYAESYAPRDEGDLLRAVRTAVERLLTPEASERARKAAEHFPPQDMARDFASVLRASLGFQREDVVV